MRVTSSLPVSVCKIANGLNVDENNVRAGSPLLFIVTVLVLGKSSLSSVLLVVFCNFAVYNIFCRAASISDSEVIFPLRKSSSSFVIVVGVTGGSSICLRYSAGGSG